MTVQETDEIIELLEMAYPAYYKNKTDLYRLETTEIWAVCLINDSFDDIKAGLIEYIKTDRSGFPPSVGQLRGIAEDCASAAKAITFFEAAVRKSMGMPREYISVSESANLLGSGE